MEQERKKERNVKNESDVKKKKWNKKERKKERIKPKTSEGNK